MGNGIRFKKLEHIHTKLCLSVMQIILNKGKFMGLIRYFKRQSAVKVAANSGRPVTEIYKAKSGESLKVMTDTRYTIRDIANVLGISLSRVHFILKSISKV